MSELGLTFDEAPAKGRHRNRRSAKSTKQRKRGGGGRSLVVLLVILLVLGGLAAGGWYGVQWVQDYTTAADYTGAGTDTTVVVEIQEGQSLAQIGQVLVDADVVASQRAFVEASDANVSSPNIQPGFYELPAQIPAAMAIELLLDLENRLIERVTIPEGRSSFQTLALISDQMGIPLEDLEEAAADPVALGVPDFWFNRTDEQQVEPSIEGFLFPSTYEFPPDPTAEQVLEAMVGQFFTVTNSIDFVDRVESERNIAPYEALIVASLAQAEAGVEEDLGKVARVAYNRVYVNNSPLQFDVTVNYWFELNGLPTKSSDEMTVEELTDPANPYNRNAEGLVPTPINNPGQAALEGAMDPPVGDWIFFVAIDDEGNSAFADTFDEHCQNVQLAIDAGILSNPC